MTALASAGPAAFITVGRSIALDPVGRQQLLGRQHRGQQRGVGRVEEAVRDAEHQRDDGQVPDLAPRR